VISKKLREEIEAVTPTDDRTRRALPPVVRFDDDDVEEVAPPPLRPQFGRRGSEPTTRDRVVRILHEHSPISQREIYWRMVRVVGPSSSLRSQISHELLLLEEHRLARRCRPPKDVDQKQAWWEVV